MESFYEWGSNSALTSGEYKHNSAITRTDFILYFILRYILDFCYILMDQIGYADKL